MCQLICPFLNLNKHAQSERLWLAACVIRDEKGGKKKVYK